MKKVSIVILNWNGEAMLRRFLPTVVAHSADIAEIVVADNASSDNSIEMLKSEFPEVRIIVLDRNYGFAGGYNHALKQVSTPYYMLLNSDVEVGENWLGPLVDFMDAHPEAAACQPKLLAEHTRDHFEYAGEAEATSTVMAIPTAVVEFSRPWRRTRDSTTTLWRCFGRPEPV